MGCPDWPKCFDQYIPPTRVNQLPPNYKDRYVAQRIKKNEKFASLLQKLGYNDLALKVRNDESIKIPEEFNASKTYTEYINRLIGALTGIILVLNFLFARIYLKIKPSIFWLSFLNLFFIVFQAWLGSVVVSTNLLQWVITIHMLLALVILGVTIYTLFEAKNKSIFQVYNEKIFSLVKLLALFSLIIVINQIALGTSVREDLDTIMTKWPSLNRNSWVLKVGESVNYHRDIALLLLVINAIVFYLLSKCVENRVSINKSIVGLLIIILLQMIVGASLNYLGLPPAAQAIHILLASLLFGWQFYVVLQIIQSDIKILKQN